MRILYVYREYRNRRKLYGDMMSLYGHDVLFLEADKKKRKLIPRHTVKKYKPDIVWLLNPYYVVKNKFMIDYIRSKKIPIVVYSTLSTGIPFNEWMEVWSKIDVIFMQNKECCDYLKSQGLNAHYMPFAFHTTQYYRKVMEEKPYDMSFCGSVKKEADQKEDKRCIFLQSLDSFNIRVYGSSFKKKLNNIPVKKYNTHKKQLDIYSKTKINLDVPFYSNSHEFYNDRVHIKNRFFEIPASGNFMLTLRCPEFLDIFDESCVGYYNNDIESLKEEVERYLKDKDIRNRKAERAYKLVNEKHSFAHRFKSMFDILNKEL